MTTLTIPSAYHFWQIIHCEIQLDKLTDTEPNRHIGGGVLWNQYTDPIGGEKFNEIYTQSENKLQGQKK